MLDCLNPFTKTHADWDSPLVVVNGWSLWFTGWKPAQDSLVLAAQIYATNSKYPDSCVGVGVGSKFIIDSQHGCVFPMARGVTASQLQVARVQTIEYAHGACYEALGRLTHYLGSWRRL